MNKGITALAEPSKFTLWANSKKNSSIFSRFFKSASRVFLISIKEFRQNEISLRSAALTYTVLLSLVPMLAMSTAVVKGLGGGDQLREVVYSYLDTLDQNKLEFPLITQEEPAPQPTDQPDIDPQLTPEATTQEEEPSSSLTGHLRSAADTLFDYVDKTDFATLGTFGVLGIFFSVLLVLNHIENAMNSIWHVKTGRAIMRKLSDYLTLLILMPLSINVGFAASAILKNQHLRDKLDIIIPAFWIQALIFKFVPIFFIAITLYIIYLFFPNTKVKTIPAFIGAFLAATLWFTAQNLYISLQVGVSNYNAIYGSFATFPLFLIWIYFGWIFILAGAQIGFAVQKRNSYLLVIPASTPSLSLSAAFDTMQAIYSSYEKNEPVKFEELKDNLSIYESQLFDETTGKLLKEKLIYQTTGDNLLVPAMPNESLTNQAIIQAILGVDTTDTTGGEESKKILSAVSDVAIETEEPQEELATSSDSNEPEEKTSEDIDTTEETEPVKAA